MFIEVKKEFYCEPLVELIMLSTEEMLAASNLESPEEGEDIEW